MARRKLRKPQVLLESQEPPFLRVVEYGHIGSYAFVVEAYDGSDALGVQNWVAFAKKFHRYETKLDVQDQMRTARDNLLWLACRELMQRRRRRARSEGGAS